ncbi:MAG: glycoside hydrolase family 16 protein, partial [Crocinitomicaceae bacterium]
MKHIIPAHFYHFFFVFLLLIPGLKGWSQVQDVFDDFEGNGDITTWFGDACNMDISFANPNIQGINTSATVLKYEDVGGQYANVRFDVSENFDLSVHHTFTLKIFIASGSITGNQNNQISLKLQDGTLGAPWETQSEIIKNVTLDEWQEISFDFENDPYINFNGGSPAPVLRTDFNRIVLQVNDENNFDFVTAYLDDISYDGSVGSCSPYNNLVWSDEFDGNGPIDNSKWFHQTFIPNGWGWFNGELQHYTDREDNSYVQNGYLHIVAKDETYTDPVQGITKEYTSARLNSKFAFTYGRVEARAKLPEGVGTWPAIWMLGKNINETGAYWQTQGFGTTGWPECGEIDIMEHWGSNQNYIQSALHTPSSFGATVNHGGLMANDVSNTFHIYAMEWTADEIIFSLDGVPYYTYSPSPQNMSTWPFIADQYILLNVAIQNSIEPSFTESEMVLDYIR